MRGRRVGLPEGHDVAGELELPTENARMKDRGQRFAQLDASPEKLVLRAVADADAVVDERTVLPAFVLANLSHRADGRLSHIQACQERLIDCVFRRTIRGLRASKSRTS